MPAHIRNTDLCALMDDERPARERERIEAALARSPQGAERLAAWRRNDAALRYAFSAAGEGMAAAPVIEAASARSEPYDAPLTDASASKGRASRGRCSTGGLRNAKAALIAGFAGGAGAAAITFATLLLAVR